MQITINDIVISLPGEAARNEKAKSGDGVDVDHRATIKENPSISMNISGGSQKQCETGLPLMITIKHDIATVEININYQTGESHVVTKAEPLNEEQNKLIKETANIEGNKATGSSDYSQHGLCVSGGNTLENDIWRSWGIFQPRNIYPSFTGDKNTIIDKPSIPEPNVPSSPHLNDLKNDNYQLNDSCKKEVCPNSLNKKRYSRVAPRKNINNDKGKSFDNNREFVPDLNFSGRKTASNTTFISSGHCFPVPNPSVSGGKNTNNDKQGRPEPDVGFNCKLNGTGSKISENCKLTNPGQCLPSVHNQSVSFGINTNDDKSRGPVLNVPSNPYQTSSIVNDISIHEPKSLGLSMTPNHNLNVSRDNNTIDKQKSPGPSVLSHLNLSVSGGKNTNYNKQISSGIFQPFIPNIGFSGGKMTFNDVNRINGPHSPQQTINISDVDVTTNS
ncbi:hypothetical protein RF11_06932 [Thelohanellus kitauei]|uniref:Uncharacterized protein n=1 Tax=Thelohanellus kitauei TaxID=669202 RepID=A0A0C2ISS8_THEKT|nr:hypothetical protein RF11_06932 [Thelohanellus kitauei]